MHACLIPTSKTARLFPSHHSSHPSPTTQRKDTVKCRPSLNPKCQKPTSNINSHNNYQREVSIFPVSHPLTPPFSTLDPPRLCLTLSSLQIDTFIEMQHTIRLNSTVNALISIPSSKKTCIRRVGSSMADITYEDQTSRLDSFDEAGCEIL